MDDGWSFFACQSACSHFGKGLSVCDVAYDLSYLYCILTVLSIPFYQVAFVINLAVSNNQF